MYLVLHIVCLPSSFSHYNDVAVFVPRYRLDYKLVQPFTMTSNESFDTKPNPVSTASVTLGRKQDIRLASNKTLVP